MQILVEVEEEDPELLKHLNAKDKSVLYQEHVLIYLNKKELYNTGVRREHISDKILHKIETKKE